MVGWILALSAIAVVFYVLIPVLFTRLTRKRAGTILEQLRTTSCFSATVVDVSRNTLTICPDKPGNEASTDESVTVQIKNTELYALYLDGRLERLRWMDLVACKTGGTIMVYPPDTNTIRTRCVFHEERNRKAFESRMAHAVPVSVNTVKPFSIAAGVLSEFIIFLHVLHSPEMTTVALLALIAIFGKALPYCPPGLILTWLGHRMTVGTDKNYKKSRQRGTVGVLIYSAGILLNVATLIFIVSSTGFGITAF